jgi:hypothetical protein
MRDESQLLDYNASFHLFAAFLSRLLIIIHHLFLGCKFLFLPCHHGMARPQVADGGDALQLWREAANILNKQSWTADKG